MRHVAPSTFAERFGFAAWLYHLRHGKAPTYAAIAEAAGRTGVAVSGWKVSEGPPPDYRVHAPVAQFFEIDERWLIRGEGSPPESDLWALWIHERRSHAATGADKRAIDEQTRVTRAAKRPGRRSG